MLNRKGTLLFSIQVHIITHTHMLRDKYVSTQLNIFTGYTFQRTQTQAHTHIAQRHTLIHSHSHNKYACNGKAHACFTHTLSSNRNIQRDTQIYTQAFILSCTDTQAYTEIQRPTGNNHTQTQMHIYTYLSRDTHPFPQPPPVSGLWRGKLLETTLLLFPSPRQGYDRSCPAQEGP